MFLISRNCVFGGLPCPSTWNVNRLDCRNEKRIPIINLVIFHSVRRRLGQMKRVIHLVFTGAASSSHLAAQHYLGTWEGRKALIIFQY